MPSSATIFDFVATQSGVWSEVGQSHQSLASGFSMGQMDTEVSRRKKSLAQRSWNKVWVFTSRLVVSVQESERVGVHMVLQMRSGRNRLNRSNKSWCVNLAGQLLYMISLTVTQHRYRSRTIWGTQISCTWVLALLFNQPRNSEWTFKKLTTSSFPQLCYDCRKVFHPRKSYDSREKKV